MTDKNIAIRVGCLERITPSVNRRKNISCSAMQLLIFVKAPFKCFHRAPPAEEFRALKDVLFDVDQRRGCGDYRAEWCREVDAAIRFYLSNDLKEHVIRLANE
jgi:hypothetical protein